MQIATTYLTSNEQQGQKSFGGRISIITNLNPLSNIILIGIILIISLIIIG